MRPALFLAVCLTCSAQLKLDVRQVLVPVIVTDKKGRHVTGLHASDFHIFEDGIEQEIAAFNTNVIAAQPAGASAPRRTYVICLDTLHSSFANSGHVRDALEKLFEHDPGADSQYVLVNLGRQLQMIQTATHDSSAILSRIRSKDYSNALSGAEATNLAAEVDGIRRRMEQYCRSCPCGLRAPARSCDPEQQQLKMSIDAQAERTGMLTNAFLAGLKSLVEELAKLSTERKLVLVSDGFNLRPGREFYAVVAAYLPNSPYWRSSSEDMEPVLQQTLSIAAERNVTIYTLDSRGSYSPSVSRGLSDATSSGMGTSARANRGGAVAAEEDRQQSSVTWENASGMDQLARATGGVFFHDNNDLLKSLRTALADGREYYMIAYVPKNPAQDGKYRRITVELGDKKLNVRAKPGYWAM